MLVDGAAAAYLERGGASVQLLPAADDADTLRLVVIKRVDGEPVS